ncbi:hypothetical protein, partial [Mesorhizobium japonicum]|uniref:hypothetical protein n=1 Tax=Mesorhizobium japonicum TaxID=2066070 RepID=UPI003B5C8E02
ENSKPPPKPNIKSARMAQPAGRLRLSDMEALTRTAEANSESQMNLAGGPLFSADFDARRPACMTRTVDRRPASSIVPGHRN